MLSKKKKDEFFDLLLPLMKPLERFALVIAGNNENAKDIVSETVLQAYRGFEKLKNKQAFLSYLFTIASRKQADYYRKNSRMEYLPDGYAEILPDKSETPEQATDAQLLREALKELDGESREALILFEFSGFKQKEIAEIQSTTVANIKVRIHRAKNKLARILKTYDMEILQKEESRGRYE